MTAGTPGSSQIAELVRQLQPPADAALWVGTLWVHHVEAMVVVAEERLTLAELGVLRAVQTLGSATVAQVAELIGHPFAWLVRRLSEQGMLMPDATGRWRLTSWGERSLHEPQTPWPRWQRREFFFLHHPDGRPRFVAFTASGLSPLSESGGRDSEPKSSDADPAALAEAVRHCIQQTPDWKRAHHFPQNVQRLLADATEPPLPAWRSAARGRLEQISLAIVVQKDALRAFLVSPFTWGIAARDPIVCLTGRDAVTETFGDLLAEPDSESWHAAWRGWCQARGIPLPEASGIHFQRRGLTLVVSGHPLRPERLRALATDEEHWLLAGAGPLRCAARLEFGRPSPHP